MMRFIYFLLGLAVLTGQSTLLAQISLGGGQPDPLAVLDLKSPTNNKVFLPPRLTTNQRLAITTPPLGAFVYDLDKNTMYLYDGQNWLPLLTADPSQLAPTNRVASDGVANDRFGTSVAISGDYAIVGANAKTINGNDSQGAAYIFVRSGSSWTQQQRLIASDGASLDNFGTTVSISGDYAIVGANAKTIDGNIGQGAAYIFVRSGSSWTQQQRLVASDGAANDRFGTRVSISGDYAIVGANAKNIGNNNMQGAAYVFIRSGNNWTQQQRLVASDGAIFDNFGIGVAISGDYAIITADNKTIDGNIGQGAAYVFVRSGSSWTQQQRLVASDGGGYEYFGNSVAISGNYAVVGNANKIINNIGQGAAYVFTRSGSSWSQQRLVASDGAASDLFGRSVAISGNYLLVGASGKDIGGSANLGAAYVFMRSGSNWLQQQRVTDSSPGGNQNGNSVGLSNGTYIIGGFGYQSFRGKVGFGTVN